MYILPVYNSTYARLNNTGSALRAAPAFKAQRCTMFLNSKELNFVNNILKKCVYSKKSMLVNPDFKLKIKGNTAILKNFYQNMDTPHRTEGICEELVFKTGNILSEQFSNKYHVNAVNCLTSAYGMLHNFIFITPKTPENTEAINTLLKVSRHLKVLADYLKYAVSEKDLMNAAYIKGQMWKLELKHKYFDESLIIDPSLKKIMPFNSDEAENLYPKINFVYNINDFNPVKDKDLKIIINQNVSPLGLTGDIAPEVLKYGFKPDDLISLKISKQADNTDIKFPVYRINGEKIQGDIKNILPEKHILNLFYKRITQ